MASTGFFHTPDPMEYWILVDANGHVIWWDTENRTNDILAAEQYTHKGAIRERENWYKSGKYKQGSITIHHVVETRSFVIEPVAETKENIYGQADIDHIQEAI